MFALRNRAVVALVLLVGASAAWAGDPWDEKDLDLPALQESLEAVKQEVQALGDGTDDERQRKELLAARSERLQELITALTAQATLPGLLDLEQRKAAAETALADLKRDDGPRVPVVAGSKEDLTAYDTAHKEAVDTHVVADRLVAEREKERRDLEAELRGSLPGRLTRARQLVEALSGKTATALDQLRLGNARLALRAIEARKAHATAALPQLGPLIDVLGLQRDVAALERDRAMARLAEASTQVAAELERLRKEAEARVAQTERDRQQERDPIKRFEMDVAVQVEEAAAAEARSREREVALDQEIQKEKDATERLKKEADLFRQRLEVQSGRTERIGERLQMTMLQLKRGKALIRSRRLPQVQRQLEQTLTERAEVQDRIWQLEVPLEDDPPLAGKLIESLKVKDETTVARAREAYVTASERLKEALRRQERTLGGLEARLTDLTSLRLKRLEVLDAQQTYLLSQVYWVRTDPPLSLDTLSGAAHELKRFWTFYARGVHRETSSETVTARPIYSLATLVWIVGGLLALLWVRRRRTHRRLPWLDRGNPLRVAVQHLLAAVVASAIVPLYLFVAARLLHEVETASQALHPLHSALELLAVVLFVRGFAKRLLAGDSDVRKKLGLPSEPARQIMQSVDWAAFAWVLFLIPWGALHAEPFQFTDTTRLLFTGFLLGMAVAVALLLRREAPLMQALLGRSHFRNGLWKLLGPLLTLALFGIVLLDALGFRVGAQILIEHVGQTFLAVLLVAGVYVGLRLTVQAVAQRTRKRAVDESDRQTAHEVSTRVVTQLTRVSTVVVVVLAVLVLAGSWEIDDAARSVLEGVHLATVEQGSTPDQDVFLSLWDVGVALLWIVGAHFLVRNGYGVLEVLVFPVFAADAGGRYVLATFARYVVLLVAYSAALLTLHFSFTSVGWLLAAAGVGLGFGLQEIVANFISGIILLIERPIGVGDIIQIGDTMGIVEKISTRSTVITNIERQAVVIPNKSFITQNVTNWTRNDQVMRRVVQVGVAYGADVERVMRILHEVVGEEGRIVKDPKPRFLFQAFGDSSLNLEVWFFARVTEGLDIRSDLNKAIHRRFAQEGITIPFPQRDLHVKASGDSDPLDSLVRRREETAGEPSP